MEYPKSTKQKVLDIASRVLGCHVDATCKRVGRRRLCYHSALDLSQTKVLQSALNDAGYGDVRVLPSKELGDKRGTNNRFITLHVPNKYYELRDMEVCK